LTAKISNRIGIFYGFLFGAISRFRFNLLPFKEKTKGFPLQSGLGFCTIPKSGFQNEVDL
jgi:hypothetical protein